MRDVARAVLLPLGAASLGATALGCVVAVAVPGSGVPAFLLQVVVLVVGVGAAFLLDEPALEVTQVTPRARARRLVRVVPSGMVVLVAAWIALVAVAARWTPELSATALAVELFGVAAAALAASAVLLRRGDARPGNRVATVIGLVALTELVGRPAASAARLLPDGLSPAPPVTWGTVLAVVVLTFAAGSRDVAAPPVVTLRQRARPATPG
jgi:hypothetical protein